VDLGQRGEANEINKQHSYSGLSIQIGGVRESGLQLVQRFTLIVLLRGPDPMSAGIPRVKARHRELASVLAFAAVAAISGCGGQDDAGGELAESGGGAGGEELYQANCASCHGSDLRGTPKGPSHLSIVYEPGHHGDDAFRSAIANGSPQHHWTFGDMPPVEGLSSSEVDAIIAYVRDVQQREGLEGTPTH
jgi:mono/diheme cytochrome c family protein